MKEMMTSGDYADVTLVCDDKKKLRAHRNILAACSPVFKEIFQIENTSVIFLKGVNFSEMESILQFIYLGEATFYEERMNHFLEAAKSLDIEGLNKNMEEDETEEHNNTVEDSAQANGMEDSEITNDHYQTIYQNHQIVVTLKDRQYKSTKVEEIQNYKHFCVECDQRFAGKGALYNHKKAVHEGVTYDCNQCDYRATNKGNLKRHVESMHEGNKSFQ